jgi:ankyrin repeat protein
MRGTDNDGNKITSLLAFRHAANARMKPGILTLKSGEDRAVVYGQLLVKAAKADDLPAMAVLILKGADVNVRDNVRMTPLHWTARNGSEEGSNLLISSGRCDYTLYDFFERYASDLAFEVGRNYDLSEKLFDLELEQAKERGIKLRCKENVKLLDLD